MFLFETILFYNGAPSYYKVYQQSTKYYFEATPVDYYKHIDFPNFYLTETDSHWQLEGFASEKLVEQAVEDLHRHVDLYKQEVSL